MLLEEDLLYNCCTRDLIRWLTCMIGPSTRFEEGKRHVEDTRRRQEEFSYDIPDSGNISATAKENRQAIEPRTKQSQCETAPTVIFKVPICSHAPESCQSMPELPRTQYGYGVGCQRERGS